MYILHDIIERGLKFITKHKVKLDWMVCASLCTQWETCSLHQCRWKAESSVLSFYSERIYHTIITFLNGWMQHNDCVIMQIIVFTLMLSHMSCQAWPYLICVNTAKTSCLERVITLSDVVHWSSLMCEWLFKKTFWYERLILVGGCHSLALSLVDSQTLNNPPGVRGCSVLLCAANALNNSQDEV